MPSRFRKITAALAGLAILSASMLGTAAPSASAAAPLSPEIRAAAKLSPVNPILKAQEADINEFAKLLNDHRAAHGLSPLKFNELASIEAYNWSKRMGRLGDYRHTYTEEHDAVNWKLSFRRSENIAKRTTVDPQALFWQWKNSPPHNAAMLSKTEDSFGIGFYRTTPADPNHKMDGIFGTTLFFRARADQLPKTHETSEDYFAGKPPIPTVNDSLLRIVPAAVTIAPDLKTFTVPQQVGARYYDRVTQKFLVPGKHTTHDNNFSVVATEQDGYRFVVGSKVEWSAWRYPDTLLVGHTPYKPFYWVEAGKFGLRIPYDRYADYYANGVLVGDGMFYANPGPVTFTVKIRAEYEQDLYIAGIYETWEFDMVQRTEVTGIKPVTFDRAKRTYVIPSVPNAVYLVNGKKRAPGKYTAALGETVNVSVAPASDNHSIPNANAYVQSYQFNREIVTPPVPRVYIGDVKYTIPVFPGVQYLVDGIVRAQGTYPGTPGAKITISVRANPGYLVVGETSRTYEFDYFRAVPEEPHFDVDGRSVRIPLVDGVDYYLNGTKAQPGSQAVTEPKVTVVAKPKKGYKLSGTTSWSHTVVPKMIVVQATRPTSDALTGKYTLRAQTGVDYFVNGIKKVPGTYASNFTLVKVTAKARSGYKLSGTTSWDLDLRKKVTTTTATTPTFNASRNSVAIPARTGVSYLINGKPTKAGVHTGHSGTGTVTAKASSSSYKLTGKASWTFDNRNAVKPTAPTFNTSKNTITIKATTGASYYIDGKLTKTGTHKHAGQGTVTTRAANGSYKTIGTTSWKFDNRNSVKPRVPVANKTKKTLTIGATTGISYSVNGKSVAPGTYKQKSGTTKVTAKAANSTYKVSGAASWSFKF